MNAPVGIVAKRFDMNAAVDRLLALAANKRAARPLPLAPDDDESIGVRATPFRLCSLADFPEPGPDWEKADAALKAFASELVAAGGVEKMVEVYDEAAERHGYRAIQGVSASWDGCHGWWH